MTSNSMSKSWSQVMYHTNEWEVEGWGWAPPSLAALPMHLFTLIASLSESYLSYQGKKPPSGPLPSSPFLVAGLWRVHSVRIVRCIRDQTAVGAGYPSSPYALQPTPIDMRIKGWKPPTPSPLAETLQPPPSFQLVHIPVCVQAAEIAR